MLYFSFAADVVSSFAFAADAVSSLAFAVDVVFSLAFVADVVPSLAFAADAVDFRDIVVLDKRLYLLQKVPIKLLEISKLRKRVIERHTLFSRQSSLFPVAQQSEELLRQRD